MRKVENKSNNGFEIVLAEGRYNLMDKSRRFVSKQWFDSISHLFGDKWIVKDTRRSVLGAMENVMDGSGRLLSQEWFKSVEPFMDHCFIVTSRDLRYNVLFGDGSLLSDTWFILLNKIKDHTSVRCLESAVNKNWRLYDTSTRGKMFDGPLYEVGDKFSDGFLCIKTDGGCNFIDKSGKLLNNTLYKEVLGFSKGKAMVKDDTGWHYIGTDGKLIENCNKVC